MNQDIRENEIDIKQLFFVIVKKWWIIVITAVIFALSAFIYNSFLTTPKYTARTQVLIKVMTETDGVTTTNITASQQLVSTFVVILKSNNVVDTVVENIPYSYSRSQIRSMISASVVSSTAIMEIAVTCEDPEHARVIADTVREYGIPEIIRLYGAGTVVALGQTDTPTSPSSPNVNSSVIIFTFIGIFLAAAFCVVVEMFNTKIKTEDDLTQILNLPIIGVIPRVQFNKEDDITTT